MTLQDVVDEYVEFKKVLGFRFHTNATVLDCFSRTVGPETPFPDITSEQVSAFLEVKGALTRTWHVKHNALVGLYRYASRKNYVASTTPLPSTVPKLPPTIVPYIYSHAELRQLVKATASYQRNRSSLEPATVRTIIILLYGAGLRVQEAVSLTLGDVDLENGLLTIRRSKCGKTRWVPLGNQLTKEMIKYKEGRRNEGHSLRNESPFFVLRTSAPVNPDTVRHVFQRLRKQAGIRRNDGAGTNRAFTICGTPSLFIG